MVASKFFFFTSIAVAAASASSVGQVLPSQAAVSSSKRDGNEKFKYEWKLPKSRKVLKSNDESIRDTMHEEGRVMPWVSIGVLLIFLFSFRSFAAPFFDPLVSVQGRGFVYCYACCKDGGNYLFANFFFPFMPTLITGEFFLLTSLRERENHANQVALQYTFPSLQFCTFGWRQ